ncbi:hypothetical protein, partial [Bradyrhizobium guangdongense]|uniref:hypothetical protein n=1 Tax=Bradyrhizobium guangdongense TaxID=1325090 RepID=UPI001AED091E
MTLPLGGQSVACPPTVSGLRKHGGHGATGLRPSYDGCLHRHCEARSDEAIQAVAAAGFWIAALAMTENYKAARFFFAFSADA